MTPDDERRLFLHLCDAWSRSTRPVAEFYPDGRASAERRGGALRLEPSTQAYVVRRREPDEVWADAIPCLSPRTLDLEAHVGAGRWPTTTMSVQCCIMSARQLTKETALRQRARDACLNGATGMHAHVMIFTITDKEFPQAYEVFERFGPLGEVLDTAAYAPAASTATSHLPFALVQSDGLTTVAASASLTERIRQFRPQVVLVVGTAGAVHRPVDGEAGSFTGPARGDVLVGEYVHHTNFVKSEPSRYLIRYLPIDQPGTHLVADARQVRNQPTWHQYLGSCWVTAGRTPSVHFGEILSGDTLADDPLEPRQQTLMEKFDKALGIEMESSGIGYCLHRIRTQNRVAVHYNPTFLTIRGVSDVVYGRGPDRPLTQVDIDVALEKSGTGVGKTVERATWSPRAASAAAAFAAAVTQRAVAYDSPRHPGHPPIPAYSMDTALDTEAAK